MILNVENEATHGGTSVAQDGDVYSDTAGGAVTTLENIEKVHEDTVQMEKFNDKYDTSSYIEDIEKVDEDTAQMEKGDNKDDTSSYSDELVPASDGSSDIIADGANSVSTERERVASDNGAANVDCVKNHVISSYSGEGILVFNGISCFCFQ